MIRDLKDRISRAFEQMKPPQKNDIAEAADWDAVAINKDFSLFLNKPVDASVLERHEKSLSALTPRAFVFFLKDYMLYTLDHLHEIESTEFELVDILIYRLADLKVNDGYWVDRLKLLTSEQVKVILDFCYYLEEQMPEIESFLKQCLKKAIVAWGKVDKGKRS